MSLDRSALVPAALSALTLLVAVAALLSLWRAGRRRASRRARARALEFQEAVEGFLARDVRAPALRRAVRELPLDLVWTVLDGLALRRPERRRLGEALTRWRPARAERFAVREGDPARAEIAARRLGLLCSRAARRALRHALRHGAEPVAAAAALSLARAGDAFALRWVLANPGTLAHRTPRFRFAVLRAFGGGALPLIHEALERDAMDPSLARAALETLGSRGYQAAGQAVVRRLRDPEPEVRVAAARAMGQLALHDHALSLRAALDDPHWPVRAQAARALGRMRALHCEDALAARLTDPAWWVRRHAAYALGELGRPGLDKLSEIATRSSDRYAREIALEALQGGFLQDSA